MERYAITFGEVAIIHIGSNKIGKIKQKGFTVKELLDFKIKFNNAEFINLSSQLPKKLQKENEAGILIIRNGVNILLNKENGADKMLKEQRKINYDKKYYDSRFGKTLNKRARYNIVFGDENIDHSKDYKIYSIKSFNDLKYMKKMRKKLKIFFGKKAKKLNAEGNYYFHKKSGIGFHGDTERKIIICISLGSSSTIRYCWRLAGSSSLFGKPLDVQINHGDIYIMSEKATGFDWKSRNKTRLVHAAGHIKYLTHK